MNVMKVSLATMSFVSLRLTVYAEISAALAGTMSKRRRMAVVVVVVAVAAIVVVAMLLLLPCWSPSSNG